MTDPEDKKLAQWAATEAESDRVRDLLPNTDGLSEALIRLRYPHLPRIYDVSTDSMRFATQDDIDNLSDVCRSYAEISTIVADRRKRLGLKP